MLIDMPETKDPRYTDDYDGPITVGLKLSDMIRGSRNSDPTSAGPNFRDVFWLKQGEGTLFRYPVENGEYVVVGYLMGLCKDGDNFCCGLEKDQRLPAPETRRDFPCGCACICVDFPDFRDFNFASSEDERKAVSEIVESKMLEAIQKLRGEA
jgi:hypothetical protein